MFQVPIHTITFECKENKAIIILGEYEFDFRHINGKGNKVAK